MNMRHGEPYVYCPLCDDKSWPCKAASTLGKARVAGLLPDRESAPAEDRGGKGCTLCNDPLPCRHSRVSGEKPEDSR